MSDLHDEVPGRRRPHSQPPAAPYQEIDLVSELEQLQREAAWTTGQNAKTLVKQDALRVVLTALKAHVRIPEHQTDGQISIHAIRGRMLVRADGRTFDLSAGTLLALDRGVRHDIEALEDSAFLLTIAWSRDHVHVGVAKPTWSRPPCDNPNPRQLGATPPPHRGDDSRDGPAPSWRAADGLAVVVRCWCP